jgi:pilus assembly protein Flp/PilA
LFPSPQANAVWGGETSHDSSRDKEMLRKFMHTIKEEIGTTAIEYALLSSLIALVIVGALTAVGISIIPVFTTVAATL